jgi:hypothetical protein
MMTVDPPANESPTYFHVEDVLPNDDESDESTGQVESIAIQDENYTRQS